MQTDVLSKEIIFIYGLADPKTLVLRYVGKSRNPYKRVKEHLYEAKTSKQRTYKNNWIRSLPCAPACVILEAVPEDCWQECERKWISLLRSRMSLVNGSDGGEGVTFTPDVRRRMSEARQRYQNSRRWIPPRKGKGTPEFRRRQRSLLAKEQWKLRKSKGLHKHAN
jgi:hypothetical protein